jgi:uncharacterized protein
MPCVMFKPPPLLHSLRGGLFVALLTLTLSLPGHGASVEHRVAMRDGVRLGTDVYLPEGEGPWPVIFLRFPYNKALAAGIGPEATRRGYVFVAQDTRGRFTSEGDNLPFDADGRADGQWDGFDAARWIADQAWCDGRIGTWGASAGAVTQYFLAGTGQSNVVSQHLVVGSPSLFREGIYRGGIFRKAMIEDWLTGANFAPHALELWTTNYPLTRYWREREIVGHYGKINAAALHIGGWFDIFAQATIDAFLGYQEHGGPGARGRQKLIMGPWTHGVLQEQAGELTFPGAGSTPGEVHDAWNWFDATLRSESTGLDDIPAVTYYVMGAAGEPGAPGNVWRTAQQWPPLPTESRALYLQPDRSAMFRAVESSEALVYLSDPTNPVPSLGGYELTLPAGPRDQRAIESRDDLLVFTSEPLMEPLEVTGQVVARMVMRSDAPDTDLIVRLCDVYPDGRSLNICEGALRLRLREGLDREVWLTPDETVTVEVPLWPTSVIFNRGHRLRVHVASTSSPALDPNRQNGEAPRTGEPRVARNTVLVGGGEIGSHLLMPVPRR